MPKLMLSSIRLLVGNYMPWLHGSAVAYPSALFDPTAVVDSLVGDKCTTMMGVPTHFHLALEEVSKREAAGESFDFSSLRYEHFGTLSGSSFIYISTAKA